MKFIHLTDPHVVPVGRRLYGLDSARRFERALAHINQHHSDAVFIAITGDLTHWGQSESYERLAGILKESTVPCHLALGNHDHRPRFQTIFADAPRDEAGFVQYALTTGMGTFLILDSTDPGRTEGHLCEARLRWLERNLDDCDGPLFVLLHHPPFDCGIQQMDEVRLNNPEDLWAVLEPHRERIRHLFFGHLHRALSGSWQGIPMSTVWSTNHQVEFDLMPADRLTGILGPPAYAVVLVEDDTVLVHTHHYLGVGPRYIFSDALVRDTDDDLDPWSA